MVTVKDRASSKSLDRSGGSACCKLYDWAQVELFRAARSTETLGVRGDNSGATVTVVLLNAF